MTALLVGLAGWAPAFTLAAIALGTEYSIRLSGHDGLDGLAILEAVALFATVELGLRALDARSIACRDAEVRRSSALRFAAMVAGAAVTAFVVLAVGSRTLPAPDGRARTRTRRRGRPAGFGRAVAQARNPARQALSTGRAPGVGPRLDKVTVLPAEAVARLDDPLYPDAKT